MPADLPPTADVTVAVHTTTTVGHVGLVEADATVTADVALTGVLDDC